MNDAKPPAVSQGLTGAISRHAVLIKWASLALIVLSVLLIGRQLPVTNGVQALEGWIDSLGVWGPVVFGLLYTVAVVLLVPASALTLAAGAIFGLFTGMVVVSLASNLGAALAFLISRYLARERVAAYVQRHPRFEAIDRAVTEGGWKIVALLRLSPAVPFNLQNYLYGLTGIRFWTCVLTSWLAMLPGTFLYTYLGYLGRTGLVATAGQERTRSPAEWGMLMVGLLATVLVTVYVTRLARRALRQHADLAGARPVLAPAGPGGWPWGATTAAALAVVAVSVAVLVQVNPEPVRQWFAGLFGPPAGTSP
jgi:uncharacterized membrane protein YdjX (TVP38/TMEM64 family)